MTTPLVTDSTWMIYEPEPLQDVIRNALLNALAFTDGNQKQAAKLLGLSERVLCYQLQLHGIPGAFGPYERQLTRQSRKPQVRLFRSSVHPDPSV